MKYRILTAALLSLALVPAGLMAEEAKHRMKKIIIDSDGVSSEDVDVEAIEDFLESIDVGENGEKRIVIMKDTDGEVEVESYDYAFAPEAGRRHFGMMGRHHGPRGMMRGHHGGMGKMSEDAANCVLKNIGKASSDHAAGAVVKACKTLNPMPE